MKKSIFILATAMMLSCNGILIEKKHLIIKEEESTYVDPVLQIELPMYIYTLENDTVFKSRKKIKEKYIAFKRMGP